MRLRNSLCATLVGVFLTFLTLLADKVPMPEAEPETPMETSGLPAAQSEDAHPETDATESQPPGQAAEPSAQVLSNRAEPPQQQDAIEKQPVASEGRDVHKTFVLPRLFSPIATWRSFHRLMARYTKIVKEEGYTLQNYAQISALEERMQDFFDLREVPPSVAKNSAIEASVYLYEISARFRELQPGMLPDREQAFAEMRDGYPGVWAIDDVAIAIVYIDSGDHKGSFQFSRFTMVKAAAIYEAVKNLSYMDEDVAGLHESYFLKPGPLVPDGWVEGLPTWMKAEYLSQSVWQWISMFVLIGLCALLLYLFGWLLMKLSRGRQEVVRALVRLLIPASVIVIATQLVRFLSMHFISGKLLQILQFGEWLIILAATVFVVFILGNLCSELIIRHRKVKSGAIDASLIRFAVKVVSILIAAAVLIEGATMLGFSLATVLAGAGVTGLAIALAAQESLRNVFGSVMLMLDRPFKIGQRILVRGHDGVVESIGLRSTKIRLLSGHLTTIPNEDVAKADIENVGERQSIRRLFTVSISYETPPEKIDEAVAILKAILAPREYELGDASKACINREGHPPRVYFNDLAEYAFEIMVIYWYHPPDYWRFQAFSEFINREIVERFRNAGIQLAVPARMQYLKKLSPEEAAGAIEDREAPAQAP